MKKLIFALITLFLASCAEPTITPTPPDQDAASRKKNQIVWKDFTHSLEKGNIFLVWKQENQVLGDNSNGEFSGSTFVYAVTDGTELLDPSQWIFLNAWKNANYIMIISLTSYCGKTCSKGVYDAQIGEETTCGNRFVWWMHNDLTGAVPNILPDSAYPLFQFGANGVDFVPLKVEGKTLDKDMIRFSLNGTFYGYVFSEPPAVKSVYGDYYSEAQIANGANQYGNYPGSFSYQGRVKDISAYAMKPFIGGRKSFSLDFMSVFRSHQIRK